MEEKKFTGTGICKLAGGEYRGEIVNGVFQGYGMMNFENYDLYEGDWDAGKMHGQGKYRFWDKKRDCYAMVYEGEFNHGVREGKGRMTYSNRDVYLGTWQNDRRTGDGVCWFASGAVFHGIWQFDKMVRGVYRTPDGVIYDGEIKNGQFEGYGKLFRTDGRWFEGIFISGKPYNGMLFSPDGKISEYSEGTLI